MMPRNLSSDIRELAMLPGAINFFSFNFATAIGSKSAKTSLQLKKLLKENVVDAQERGREYDHVEP